jgi:hypothetical protein
MRKLSYMSQWSYRSVTRTAVQHSLCDATDYYCLLTTHHAYKLLLPKHLHI